MNKIAVVALLAVCACVSASVDFTPHKLPCEYTIIQESNSTMDSNEIMTCTDTMYFHGTFAAVTSEVTAPTPAFNEILLRIDLANYLEDEVEEFEVHTAMGDNCTHTMVDRNTAFDYIKTHILYFFQNTMTFDSVSDGSFEGTPCKIYYMKEGGEEMYLFADKEDYIIGYNTSSGENFTAARLRYEMKAPLDKFVIDGQKYPGCSQYASIPPVVDECTDIKFKAKELPCEFTIDGDYDYVDRIGTEYTVKESLFAHGDFKGYIIKQDSPVKYFSEAIARYDVNDSHSIAVYTYHHIEDNDDDKCEGEMINKGIIEQYAKEYLAVFEDEWIFHAKAQGTYKGKKVTIYYTNTNGTELMFFVDKDDYVLGLNTTNRDGTQAVSYTYTMKAPLDKFAMDKKYEGCDSTAYKAPTYDTCNSGSQSNSGNYVTVSYAVAVVSVMLALLLVF